MYSVPTDDSYWCFDGVVSVQQIKNNPSFTRYYVEPEVGGRPPFLKASCKPATIMMVNTSSTARRVVSICTWFASRVIFFVTSSVVGGEKIGAYPKEREL